MSALGPQWQLISYVEKGLGMHTALREAGYRVVHRDGSWYTNHSPVSEVNAFIASHDPVAYAAIKETEAQVANRTEIVDEVDNSISRVGTETRALIGSLNKRINWLTNRVIELQEDLQAIKATSGPADTIRGAIRASYMATATRPRPDAVQAYRDDVAAGEGDPT